MEIAFFTYQNLLGPKIRGEDVALHLKAIYNHKYTENKVRGDLNIHIKPYTLDNVQDGDWVDVSDGVYVPELLMSRPKVKVIAHSLYSYKFLKEVLPNEIVWISQQHLNWERERKEVKEIKVCGYIGGPSEQIRKQYDAIGKSLNKAGFEFITCFDFVTREDAKNFYKKIDCLVVGQSIDDPYKTPTKLINATSFGIPSVAFPMKAYEEWGGSYTPCFHDELIPETVSNLKFDQNELVAESEFYHISNVTKRYENLCHHTNI